MKRAILVVAALGVCLVGCGGPDAEVEVLESAPQELSECPPGTNYPSCASIANQYCTFPGSWLECCNGGYALPCYCDTSGAWVCA